MNEHCAKLKHQISELTSEVDIGHLEISRQKGVIKSLEEELEKLRTENSMYQEHLEVRLGNTGAYTGDAVMVSC